jgi:hypothetical protein
MNFTETITLYRAISALTFRCPNKHLKICVVDNQIDGYALKVKKCLTQECCNCCCVRKFSKSHSFQLTEDAKYLNIQ